MPGTPKAKVRSRVIMNPLNAKRLYKALADNIAKYEQQFGTIQEASGNVAQFPIGTPTAQAWSTLHVIMKSTVYVIPSGIFRRSIFE